MNTSDQEQVEKFCQIYGKIKHYILKAEEFTNDKTYIQPRLELSNVLDHVVSEYFFEQLNNKAGSMDGAMEHLYTAFFDVADWTIMQIRSCVIRELEHYSPDVIQIAIKNYYSEIRPALDDLTGKITEIRAAKTSAKQEQVDEYIKLLDEAYGYISKVRRSQGTLIELRNKNRFKTMLGPAIGILGIIISIIIAVLT
jgi:hypothetical protein